MTLSHLEFCTHPYLILFQTSISLYSLLPCIILSCFTPSISFMLGRLRQSVNYKPAKCCVPDKEMIKFNFNSLQISFNLVKNLTYERCCKQNIFTNSKTAFIFHIRNYVQLRITVLFPYPSLALINKPIPKRFCSKRPRDVKDTCYCNIHR